MARIKKDGRRATGIQAKKGWLYIVTNKVSWKEGKKVTEKQWISTGMEDTKENVKKASEQRAILLDRKNGSSVDRDISTKDYVELFLNRKSREIKKTTYEDYQYRTNRINDYFGEKRLRDIHVFEVEQFLDELFTVKDLSPRTVKDTKSLFSTIMDQAVKDEVVFFNPVKEAVINKNLAEEHTEEKDLDDDFFSFEESEVFLRIAFGHELYELFYCALFLE